MDKEQIVAEILRMAKTHALPGRKVSIESTFNDLGYDSLDEVCIIMDAEEFFGIAIDGYGFGDAPTIGDVVDIVIQKIKGKE